MRGGIREGREGLLLLLRNRQWPLRVEGLPEVVEFHGRHGREEVRKGREREAVLVAVGERREPDRVVGRSKRRCRAAAPSHHREQIPVGHLCLASHLQSKRRRESRKKVSRMRKEVRAEKVGVQKGRR